MRFFSTSSRTTVIGRLGKLNPVISAAPKPAAWNPAFDKQALTQLLPPCPPCYASNPQIQETFQRFPGYFVNRTSKFRSLPVYLVSWRSGKRLFTCIKKIDGSVDALLAELDPLLDLSRKQLAEKARFDSFHCRPAVREKKERSYWLLKEDMGTLILRGDHVAAVHEYLQHRGF